MYMKSHLGAVDQKQNQTQVSRLLLPLGCARPKHLLPRAPAQGPHSTLPCRVGDPHLTPVLASVQILGAVLGQEKTTRQDCCPLQAESDPLLARGLLPPSLT